MSPSLDSELRQHARALRGLACALVGSNDADDLVQDAALQVLQQPQRPRSLGAFLRQVLRHLAGRHRRDRMLRHRREGEVPVPPEMPPAVVVAEHREALRRLDQALLELPEPYQGTLLLRYFEELTPSAIAARTPTPLATVKSRLQRGLAMLRERLDAGDRDWRAGLGSMLGIGRPLPVAAGGLVMASGVKLLIGGAAAALAVAAALFLVDWGQPADAPIQTGAAPAGAMIAAAESAGASSTAAATPMRTEAPDSTAHAASSVATLRGRCVDESGQPLDQVRLLLTASPKDQRKLGESEWRNQSADTNADGCFEFRFALPEHVHFWLEFRHDGCCDSRAGWNDIKAGQTLDLGDVVLRRAIPLHGRVVDTAGLPVVGAELGYYQDNRDAADPAVYIWPPPHIESTGDDGTFRTHNGMPAGRYLLRVMNRRGREPYVTLTLDAKTTALELVVLADAECPPIRGIVVDDAGIPVVEGTVTLGESRERLDHEGRFTIRPGPDRRDAGPFELEVTSRRASAKSGPHPLGASDVRIVLQRTRLPSVRVIVRAADTGEPVTGFSANVTEPDSGSGPGSTSRNKHRHWDLGVAVLEDVAPGDHTIHVDPGDGPYAPSSFVPVHVDGDTDVNVTLTRRVERRLRLQTAAGMPVRATVELLDGHGRPQPLQTIALSMAEWNTIDGPPRAVLLQQGDTDERGELVLRGPAGRGLLLRLRGTEVAMQLVQPVRLDGDGPLVITPQAGAHWSGRLLPAEVAAALFTASQPKPGEKPGRRAFGIELGRSPDEQLHTFVEPLFPYGPDGSFHIDGIPAGSWRVVVFAMGCEYCAAEITVADGQQLQQDIDVSPMRPCHVSLRILIDGRPVSDAAGNVYGEHAVGVGPQPMRTQHLLRTDEDGNLSFTGFAGRFGCELRVRDSNGSFSVTTPVFVVPPGDRFEHTLALQLGCLRLQVLRPDGQRAAKLTFELAGVGWQNTSFQTDAAGRAVLEHLPAGKHSVRTPIRSLCEEAGRADYRKRFGWQALRDAWLEVGSIEVLAGQSPAVELRLPPDWDR